MLVVDGRAVAPLEVAATRRARGRGLLGRDGIDGALWLPGVRSVHTFGMRFALDVAWIGPDDRVVHTAALRPGRLSGWHRATGVVEAEAGAFARWGVLTGSTVTAGADRCEAPGMRDDFLRGARCVLAALSRPEVAAAWDEPSVLADQTVGSLAGHLARGGVWVVDDYLDGEVATTADHASVETYYAWVATLDETAHQAIRDRGAALAGEGPDAVVARLAERLPALERRLEVEPIDRIMPVAGGTMALDDFLATRLVEQVVHLDDLGRSVGIDCAAPDDLIARVAHVGLGVALLRRPPTDVLRLLFRDQPDGVVPVL